MNLVVGHDMDLNNFFQNHVKCMKQLFILLQLLDEMDKLQTTFSKRRNRKPDSELSFHLKRRWISWSPLVRSLGMYDFERHHPISIELFKTIHMKVGPHIETIAKYARQTCCRGHVSNVDSRSRLSMMLKHLAGSN